VQLEINRLRKASCICALVGAAVLITLAAAQIIYGALMNSRASTWPIVEGQVESVVVKPRYAYVIYSYVYHQERYTGRTLSFLLRGSVAERQHILNTYRTETKVDVHVNPNAPKETVLEVRTPAIEYIRNNVFVIGALSIFSVVTTAFLRNEGRNKREE
jgi:hypothetical protein